MICTANVLDDKSKGWQNWGDFLGTGNRMMVLMWKVTFPTVLSKLGMLSIARVANDAGIYCLAVRVIAYESLVSAKTVQRILK